MIQLHWKPGKEFLEFYDGKWFSYVENSGYDSETLEHTEGEAFKILKKALLENRSNVWLFNENEKERALWFHCQ